MSMPWPRMGMRKGYVRRVRPIKLDDAGAVLILRSFAFSPGVTPLKKQLATIAMMLATASCSSTTPQPEPAFSSSQPPAPPTTKPAVVIARAGDAKVTLDQLERPLIEGYGLNILLNLVQLELVRQ